MDLFEYSYQNQYNEILLALFKAYKKARKNKRSKKTQLAYEFNYEQNLVSLCDDMVHKKYAPRASLVFLVHRPVTREIIAAAFRDRIVHHFIFDAINPIFESLFIDDSYSCRKGKGTLYGSKKIASYIKECSCGYTQDAYILKLDIKGYFYHIDKSILFDRIKKVLLAHKASLKIEYELLIYLIEITIFHDVLKNIKKCYSPSEMEKLPKDKSLFFAKEGCGLPIGNLTSQLFSNIYMDIFDRYVKEELGLVYYGRYVDDFVIIHQDKEVLLSLMRKFDVFLKNELKLTLHPKKIYLQHYSKGVQFLGSYIKPWVQYVDTRTKTNFYALVRKINKEFLKHVDDKVYYEKIRTQINSYLGTLRAFSSFKLRKKILKGLLSAFWICFGVDEEYKRVRLNCKYGYKYEKLLSSSYL